MNAESMPVIIGSVLAVILQVALAPYIAVAGAVPNIVAVFALVVAVSRPHSYGAVLPFVLGLIYDLATGGPVGAMAFSLTAFSFLVARLYSALENDTLFMPLIMVAFGAFLVEFSYGMFLLLFGYNAGLFEAIAFRVFPCFLYDAVIGIVLYLLVSRFFRQSSVIHHDITSLR